MVNIYIVLICIAIMLLPFNNLPILPKTPIAGILQEGAFLPLLLAAFFWIFEVLRQEKISLVQHSSFKAYKLFFMWIVICIFLNVLTVQVTKVIVQLSFLCIQFMFALMIASISFKSASRLFKFIEYSVFAGMAIVSIYSFFEIIWLITDNSFCEQLLLSINQFIRTPDWGIHDEYELYPGRLRSVSYEAAWFCMNMAFFFPWILNRVFIKTNLFNKFKDIILFIYILIMITFTRSRAGYAITLVQIVAYIWLLYKNKLISVKSILKASFICIPILIFIIAYSMGYSMESNILYEMLFSETKNPFLSFNDNSESSMSNIYRLATIVSGFNVFIENPFFGVGFSQLGFYLSEYVPSWAWVSPETQTLMSGVSGVALPHSFNMWVRIAAESGIIGIVLWIGVWIKLIQGVAECIKYCQTCDEKYYIITYVTLLVGVILNQLNEDIMTFHVYWISLGFGWAIIRYYKSIAKRGIV